MEIGIIFKKYKGLEIKARNNAKHLKILRTGKVESSTIWQMNMNMLVTGFKSWDFASYNPNFKQSIFIKEFPRDEKKIEMIRTGIKSGIEMLKEALNCEAVKKELENDL